MYFQNKTVLLKFVQSYPRWQYFLKCRKNAESKNLKVAKKNKGKLTLLSKCAKCDSKKSRVIKNKVPTGLLNNLGIGIPLSKIPLFGDTVF